MLYFALKTTRDKQVYNEQKLEKQTSIVLTTLLLTYSVHTSAHLLRSHLCPPTPVTPLPTYSAHTSAADLLRSHLCPPTPVTPLLLTYSGHTSAHLLRSHLCC